MTENPTNANFLVEMLQKNVEKFDFNPLKSMKFYRNKKNHLTDSLSWSGMLLINVLNHINYNNNDNKLFNFTSSIQLSSRLRLRLERKEKRENR